MYRFNVRVYGILVDNGNILVSDEFIKGKHITKLPGGGLEFGEGPAECVVREFREELNLEVEVIRHFYTTDFFVVSAFNPSSQIISIYYLVRSKGEHLFRISDKAFDYEHIEGAQSLRWIPLKDIKESNFTFVIDKRVAKLLNETSL
jgi:ADP-ribose pyrophosphatase YjhB (NUDIX family)